MCVFIRKMHRRLVFQSFLRTSWTGGSKEELTEMEKLRKENTELKKASQDLDSKLRTEANKHVKWEAKLKKLTSYFLIYNQCRVCFKSVRTNPKVSSQAEFDKMAQDTLESAKKLLKETTGKIFRVSNPKTHAGHKLGAFLKIKRQTAGTWETFAVGDYVEITDRSWSTNTWMTKTRNVITQVEAEVEWDAFFPAMELDQCYCIQSKREDQCRCIQEGPKPSRALGTRACDDPLTPSGLQVGATLQIKRLSITSDWLWLMKVGECVEVLAHHPNGLCAVKNIRTGEMPLVKWESFL